MFSSLNLDFGSPPCSLILFIFNQTQFYSSLVKIYTRRLRSRQRYCRKTSCPSLWSCPTPLYNRPLCSRDWEPIEKFLCDLQGSYKGSFRCTKVFLFFHRCAGELGDVDGRGRHCEARRPRLAQAPDSGFLSQRQVRY